MAASSSSSPTLYAPTLPSVISIKLERNNYPLWLVQMVPLLRSRNLLKFVYGTSSVPLEFLLDESNTDSSADKNDLIPNSEYELWIQQDQQVLLLDQRLPLSHCSFSCGAQHLALLDMGRA